MTDCRDCFFISLRKGYAPEYKSRRIIYKPTEYFYCRKSNRIIRKINRNCKDFISREEKTLHDYFELVEVLSVK